LTRFPLVIHTMNNEISFSACCHSFVEITSSWTFFLRMSVTITSYSSHHSLKTNFCSLLKIFILWLPYFKYSITQLFCHWRYFESPHYQRPWIWRNCSNFMWYYLPCNCELHFTTHYILEILTM